MNEVTRIHLGRQPFTISVEAHRELKAYLADIQKKVADKEVINEVELRMSELLTERGITDEKAILPEDVDYLKEQLGKPEDFGEEVEASKHKEQDQTSKRLFRDTDNAMIAGVSAGLANYFGLDVVLVRIAFVVLVLFGGGGIIIYLLMWLVVPPAVTASEKLQMRGTPVTLEALRESVSKADVSGTARRLNSRLLSLVDGVFRALVKLAGIGFVLAGLCLLAGLAIVKSYILLHNGQLFQENLFPVGAREHWLLGIGMILAAIVSIFLMLAGVATFKQKWPVRGWITGILVGLFLIGSIAASALAADAAPRIRDRFETQMHTTAVKGIQPFSNVVTNGEIDIAYIPSPDYSVNVRYFDHPDLSKLKVSVNNNTLYVDSSQLDTVKHCTMLCLFPRYNMSVQIYAPNVQKFNTPPNTDIFYPAVPPLPAKP
jgi:phage shock protein PspC (stress-responsive transcriptional regulator)